MLVVTEIALAVVLLVSAGLLLRTFSSLVRVNLGFQPAGTVTMGLFLGLRPPETRVALINQILERVEVVPGVEAAGTIQFLPLTGMNCGSGFWLEGQAERVMPPAGQPTECSLVSRGYFAVMRIPVLEGRAFDGRDRIDTSRVLMVNESFARRYFPDGRTLGRRIRAHSSKEPLAEIIGVVGDVRHNGLTSEPVPTVFQLHAQTTRLHHEPCRPHDAEIRAHKPPRSVARFRKWTARRRCRASRPWSSIFAETLCRGPDCTRPWSRVSP